MPASIVVNARYLSRRLTGVERSAAEVVSHWNGNVQLRRPPRHLPGFMGHAWEQLVLPGQLPRGALLWSPANSGPLAVSNQVVSIHDLSPLDHPEWFNPVFAGWYRWLLPALARRARCIITPSEFSRQRLQARFALPPERIVVVPGGVNPRQFHPADSGRLRDIYPLPERYLLFVGSLQPRKNLPALLAAWQLARRQFPHLGLVVIGTGGPAFRQTGRQARCPGLYFPGYVPDRDLPAFYSGAAALVLPSFYEGFGLPALEAMACGTPVLASCAGALPEVVAEAGLLFDPFDPLALSRQLVTLLGDDRLQEELCRRGLARAREFTWQRSAAGTWEVLRGCQ
jgi:glycosyltransferase involved in cell wall biosynthesis